MEILSSISIIMGIIASITGFKLYTKQGLVDSQAVKIIQLEKSLNEQSKSLNTLTKFCSTVTTTINETKNVIIIGPRASGKSSIVTLWCKVSKLIESIAPTVSFNTYDYKLEESREEIFFDKKIGVNRLKRFKQLLKIFDYAGEDGQIPNAISNISDSPECTIVMVFNCDPGYTNDNRKYFSRSLIEKINKTFDKKNTTVSSVKKVFVVFNKVDLYANNDTKFDSALELLKKEYDDSITNIESVFGLEVHYLVTSASTNHNIINLLQKVIHIYDGKQ